MITHLKNLITRKIEDPKTNPFVEVEEPTWMKPLNGDNPETKRSTLVITTLASFLSPFGISSVNIALPSIGQEFQMDAILLGWITTSYLLATAMCLIPFGKIADLYGRKRIFTCGVLIFTLASVGLAISGSAAMLICFRILQGIGGAAIYPVGSAILTSVYPSGELGKALGINVAAVYLGFSAGPSLGGFLTQHLGWRSIFVANIILGIGILSLIFWKLRGEWQEAGDEKFDFIGSLIFGFTLLFIMYGFSQLSTIPGVGLVLIGATGILIFIKWEMKTKSPVFDINLFRNNRVFVFSNLAAFINFSATFALTFLLSLYLQYIKKLPPENAGLILVSQPIVQAFFSPLSGRLSDKIEPRIVASIGMGLAALGLSLLAFLSEKTTIGFIVASLVLLGFGFAFFASPNTYAVMRSVENKFYGVAAGTLGTMRITGMVFSMGITILILSIYIGKVQITPDYYSLYLRSTRLAFTFFAVFCFGGVLASLARGKVR